MELFVFGGGSNLVIADEGFDGLLVRPDIRGYEWRQDGADTYVTVGAGEPWDPMVAACAGRGLTGVECLSGIPGTVGGTPIQNVGAYGQEVSETIAYLTAYDRLTDAACRLEHAECAFSYRMSRFKRDEPGRFVVCDVTFRMRAGVPVVQYPDLSDYLEGAGRRSPGVADVREAVLAVRRRKGMVIDPVDPDTRSVGSFFMNPLVPMQTCDDVAATAGSRPPAYPASEGRAKLSAAWLIERAGFHRGDADGPVGISTKHSLALVNRGGATARDVLRFAARVKRRVLDHFGVNLRPEPVFVGFGADEDLEFLQS